ncbi:nucleotide-binding protein [Salinicoccus cyprini]|uniref:Nucleotide-binding protein n=1 Tax=Salinicoccus cyprini TaxID=2493691 RepID=A0A558ARC1_9STAP|nr:nucleotide-binding protein [Salinicoccus cyprini]TVT26807.1 nucleotide-binding protein [Salinicoccus cyprini]
MDKVEVLSNLKERVKALEYNDDASLRNLKLQMRTTLKKILDNSEVGEYLMSIERTKFYLSVYTNGTPESKKIQQWENGKKELIGLLDVILHSFILEGALPQETETTSPSFNQQNTNVFIVHGHDDAMKLTVKDYLVKLGLNPIILHEQLDEGDTIIEKFEREAKNVSYAIILLSPDDVGKAISAEVYLPRARQNVILELGFFTGKLGRKRTFNLLKNSQGEELEQPNDFSGVVYHQFDPAGGWKLKLGQSLKAAGFDIDFNLLL